MQWRIYSSIPQPGADILVPPSCTQTLSSPALPPCMPWHICDVPTTVLWNSQRKAEGRLSPEVLFNLQIALNFEFPGGSGPSTLPLLPLHPLWCQQDQGHWPWPQWTAINQDLTLGLHLQSCSVSSPALEVLINNQWDNIEIIFFFSI